MLRGSVGKWRRRFAERRLAGIERDAPRPGRPSPDRQALTEKILEATTQTKPEDATHKHPKVRAWLKRHPRFHMHFTPTSSRWLNLVEHFFAELTNQRLRRGTFRNVRELQAALAAFASE